MNNTKIALRIADNINQLKQSTVNNIFQIGKLLLEAKEVIPHGEWKNWLEGLENGSDATK